MNSKMKDALKRADRFLLSALVACLVVGGSAIAYVSTQGDLASASDNATPVKQVAAFGPVPINITPNVSVTPNESVETAQIASLAALQIVAAAPAPVAVAAPPIQISDEMAAQLIAQSQCLAEAMYYEARGEGTQGQLAVAEVIYNRMRAPHYPRTICGVVHQGAGGHSGCQFSFACDGQMDRPREQAEWRHESRLALQIVFGRLHLGDMTGGATSFHAVAIEPGISDGDGRTIQIGNHVFYHPGRRTLVRGA